MVCPALAPPYVDDTMPDRQPSIGEMEYWAAYLRSCHDIILLSQDVHQLALALITPLRAQNDSDLGVKCFGGRLHDCARPRLQRPCGALRHPVSQPGTSSLLARRVHARRVSTHPERDVINGSQAHAAILCWAWVSCVQYITPLRCTKPFVRLSEP